MNKLIAIISILFFIFSCKTVPEETESKQQNHPNILLFYVDDLGYGDLGCYGAVGVETPNIDSLAAKGVRFTDAHSFSATCTPSRYSLLTGRYAFRRNASILEGDASLLIDTSTPTLPKFLRKAGYSTGIVGKWHLGLGNGNVDWNTHVAPGPNEIGFNYSFILPATGDRVPTVYMKNGFVVSHEDKDPISVNYSKRIGSRPTGSEIRDKLKQKADRQHSNSVVNGVSRIGYMAGGQKAEWIDEDFPYKLTDEAKAFIDRSDDKPFFLYYSFHDIHVPRLPHKNFKGKSSLGPRGDAIAQVDYVVGELMQFLKTRNKLENTLIIFTSDNGPVLNDGYEDQARELLGAHQPAGIFNGGKYSNFEGGTKVPTITYWEGNTIDGASGALMSQVDIYASLAKLVDQPIDFSAIDSEEHLDALLGKTVQAREYLVSEGSTLSIRNGKWKYIQPMDSSKALPLWIDKGKGIASGASYNDQLYDLEKDPGETINVANDFPDVTDRLKAKLNGIKDR